MKRLGIYFFYDKDGIVDDYVPYYLSKLKPFCKELCVVVNKPLSKSGEQKLYAVTDKLIIRDNIGFDSCAYKEAIESYGYDTLKLYDELILCNFTCYGPVFPFSEMFSKMEKSDCDFWGISRYPRIENKRICDQQETDYVPEHIMSFFMGIRKKMLSSRTFKKYWDNLKVATNYAEAVAFNELLFTPYFEKHGFKSDTFISPELNKKFRENGATFTPCDFLKVRCPIVKRRAFFTDYSLFLYFENGLQSRTALDYIAKYTDYNVNLIWDNLIRTQPGSVLKRNLHLNYFLNEDLFYGNEENLKESLKTALLCYIYYPDMIDYCLSYAKNLPSWVDIYIFTVDPQVSEKVGETFAALPNRVTVRCKENRGQLASAVLISGKDIFEKYDLVCITQAKKSSQLVDRFS